LTVISMVVKQKAKSVSARGVGSSRTVLDLEYNSRTNIMALASKRSGLGLDALAFSHL